MGDFRYLDIDSQIVYELRNVWEDEKVILIMYLSIKSIYILQGMSLVEIQFLTRIPTTCTYNR